MKTGLETTGKPKERVPYIATYYNVLTKRFVDK